MFVAALYLTLSYFVSFVHDYWNKLTNYRAIIQTYRAIFKFSHLPRDKFELSRDNLRKKKIAMSLTGHRKYCTLSLLRLGRFSEGILINISSKKNAFVRVFTRTIL